MKTPIPGTEWLRVLTTEGNTFYTHTTEKRSVWTVPEEIRDAVAQLEREEAEKKAAEAEAAHRQAEEDRARQVEQIQREVGEMVGKRKAEEPVPMEEFVVAKKAKMDGSDEEEEEDDEEEDEESEEEEEWQREAAAQLAAEAEAEERRREEERIREEEEARKLKEAEKQKGSTQLNMPARVDLSIDEAKALFKVRWTHLVVYINFLNVTADHEHSRLYCARRTLTPSTLGILLFLSSCLILAMFSFPPSPRDVRRSTNIAVTARESCDSQR